MRLIRYKYDHPYYIMYEYDTEEIGDRPKETVYYREIWRGKVVAIGFSFNPDEEIEGTLHKHGDPIIVNRWAKHTRKSYIAASKNIDLIDKVNKLAPGITQQDYIDLAKAIIVFQGRLGLIDLNKCIEITGYVGKLYKRVLKLEERQ